tara:strand:+ start:35 stop:202 length:168 start_codon:yes stop_codon:yes gene_type:complete
VVEEPQVIIQFSVQSHLPVAVAVVQMIHQEMVLMAAQVAAEEILTLAEVQVILHQ